MEGAIGRMRQIHHDLRTFIRGDTPEHVLGDVNEGLRATVALLSRRIPSDLQLELALDELPRISFQPGQLNQVWHNLVQNAFDALGKQGRVAIRALCDGDVIEVSIADDGPGVAPEHRGRLFEPFFTTKPIGQGTGLGLATSYQIVARHGGTLSLDPEHHPGARFVVRLPIASAEAAASIA
jgi:two-component system, NtrC family, sensor kinase